MKQNEQGRATEKFVVKTLKSHGYWAYNIPNTTNGQPCDIVGIKGIDDNNTISWLIDAKHVRKEEVSFTFNRIEPNQISALAYAIHYANIKNVGFAIFFDREKTLYWLPFLDYVNYERLGHNSINMNNLVKFEKVLEDANNNK